MCKNIILIGMSGAGKTTIGIAVSHKLKKPFVDVDAYIEKKCDMTISKIFERYGEEHFRKLETEAIQYLCDNYKNTIISTGGGAVLNASNMKNLKKSGVVVYVQRSVESILSTLNAKKRPLLAANPQNLYDMYKERHSRYLKYADICVLNNESLNKCVENIIDAINART